MFCYYDDRLWDYVNCSRQNYMWGSLCNALFVHSYVCLFSRRTFYYDHVVSVLRLSVVVNLITFLARQHFSAEELLLYPSVGVGIGVHMRNVRANANVLEFKSFCIFSCTLTLLIVLIKPLTTKAYDSCASCDCGTFGLLLLWNHWTEFNKSLTGISQCPQLSLCFFLADCKNKMAPLASDRLRHFLLLLWNPCTELNETY